MLYSKQLYCISYFGTSNTIFFEVIDISGYQRLQSGLEKIDRWLNDCVDVNDVEDDDNIYEEDDDDDDWLWLLSNLSGVLIV
ncbi:hypothetical protein DFA_06705 [Cavenderia fasciculata]|uniref:Uncharacterized protein n=1 Tax=Cavenderia fasciculata TaxID=261658 RepID=F4Q218_CACFS|nr:uncharacterized protein DFA_06705 [Cavenderia fasciculata]EGG18038.1 hypothetical protein DFA_06705 [Cavenderia fasciculata]|eukprot:XP_004356931.1 hypothetical protein DFA_06705 [Cavenderia fasciculata]